MTTFEAFKQCREAFVEFRDNVFKAWYIPQITAWLDKIFKRLINPK